MSCNNLFARTRATRRGTAAVEFAIVAPAFLMLLVGFLQVAFCVYAQSVLDFAAASVARQFQTGGNQSATGSGTAGGGGFNPNDANFKANNVCPALNGLLDCTAVQVLNYPVNDYQSTTSNTNPNPGGSKTTMILKLVYTTSVPTWPVLAGTGSSNPFQVTAIIPYVNEF